MNKTLRTWLAYALCPLLVFCAGAVLAKSGVFAQMYGVDA